MSVLALCVPCLNPPKKPVKKKCALSQRFGAPLISEIFLPYPLLAFTIARMPGPRQARPNVHDSLKRCSHSQNSTYVLWV